MFFHIVLVLLLGAGRGFSAALSFELARYAFVATFAALLNIVKGLYFEAHALTEGPRAVYGVCDRGADDGVLATEGNGVTWVRLVGI